MNYQLTVAKLPFAPRSQGWGDRRVRLHRHANNETLVRDLAGGGFLASQRNLVLVGGTGSGKPHPAVGIARACIRSPTPRRRAGLGTPGVARGRFSSVVDPVNKLHVEARASNPQCRSWGRTADHLCRLDFVILDELGYLPFKNRA